MPGEKTFINLVSLIRYRGSRLLPFKFEKAGK